MSLDSSLLLYREVASEDIRSRGRADFCFVLVPPYLRQEALVLTRLVAQDARNLSNREVSVTRIWGSGPAFHFTVVILPRSPFPDDSPEGL